jgi:pimeloyl-ACP methyl ester carboxylesterase
MKQHYIAGGNGLKLYVEESGPPQGQSILFIHGFMQCRLAWINQVRSELAETFRLVTFDLRGHGLAEKPAEIEAYNNGQLWADDLAAIIDGLHLQRPVLVGSSYGGYVIMDYIRYYGQANIGGINFAAAATKIGSPEANAMLGKDFLATIPGLYSPELETNLQALQAFVRLMSFKELEPEDYYMTLGYNAVVPPLVRRGLFKRKQDNDDLLAQLTVPLLITHGLEDEIVLLAEGQHHAQIVKHAQTSYYEQTGHCSFKENPARFNTELAAFATRMKDEG